MCITYDGNVKIVDFGIAKAATQSNKTQIGTMKGKIAYMSPEQAEGKTTIDHRSDIFSTGILLYELITGKRMFSGDSTLKLLSQVQRLEYDPPEQVNENLPPKLYDIIHQALEKEPEQRYQSCDDMLTDLEEMMAKWSMRPTSRELSQYMTRLFDDDIHTEREELDDLENVLPNVSAEQQPGKDRDAENEVSAPYAADKSKEVIIPKSYGREKPWWYRAIPAFVVMLGVLLIFIFMLLPGLLVDYGREANRQQQFAKAVWYCQSALALRSSLRGRDDVAQTCANARVALGKQALEAESHDEAFEHFKIAHDFVPDVFNREDVAQDYARLHVAFGKKALEAENYDEAQKRLDTARELAPDIEAYPDFLQVAAQLHVVSGRKALEADRYAEAQEHFDIALRSDASIGEDATFRQAFAQLHVALGQEALESGGIAVAQEHFDIALKSDASIGEDAAFRQAFAQLHVALGQKALESGGAAAAQEHFDIALRSDASIGEDAAFRQAFAQLHVALGQKALESGGAAAAQEHFDREHSVILTPHREAFYNREKLVNHPVGKDSPWDKLRFSRYPRFVQENNGTTCAKTSISALTSGLMTSKHVCLTRQAPYPRSATWCGSYAKTSRAVSLKRCSTMLTHRSTTERRPLVPSVSGASRLALP